MREPELLETACPSCSNPFDVGSDVLEAHCPHCDTLLRFEGSPTPGDASALPAGAGRTRAPPANGSSKAPPAASAASAAPATDTPAPDPPKARGKTHGKRGGPSPAKSDKTEPDLPAAVVPQGGVPHSLTCPSCSKPFLVPPNEAEGNCPHCNAPLAFIAAKEYQALQLAEQRKKSFQERLLARRQKEKEREEALVRKEEEKRRLRLDREQKLATQGPGPLEPSGNPLRRLLLRKMPPRVGTKAPPIRPATPGAKTPPASPSPKTSAPDERAEAKPERARWWLRILQMLKRRKAKEVKAPTPEATQASSPAPPKAKRSGKPARPPPPALTLEKPSASGPSKKAPPTEPGNAKPSFWTRWRVRKQPEAGPGAGSPSAQPAASRPKDRTSRQKTEPPPASIVSFDVSAELTAAPAPSAAAKKSRWPFGRRKGGADAALEAASSPLPPKKTSKTKQPSSKAAPASPDEGQPKAPKGGLFARLRRARRRTPQGPAAVVEVGAIQISGLESEAPAGRKRGRR